MVGTENARLLIKSMEFLITWVIPNSHLQIILSTILRSLPTINKSTGKTMILRGTHKSTGLRFEPPDLRNLLRSCIYYQCIIKLRYQSTYWTVNNGVLHTCTISIYHYELFYRIFLWLYSFNQCYSDFRDTYLSHSDHHWNQRHKSMCICLTHPRRSLRFCK